MIYDVLDLDVYNRSVRSLHLIYDIERKIPRSHQKLAIQITSAAESVPANIAEGFAKRRSTKEWKRFLEIGMGSSDEVITHARTLKVLATYIKFIDTSLCDAIIEEYKIISKQLNKLRSTWIDYKKH